MWHTTPYASAVAIRARPGGGRKVEIDNLINRTSGDFFVMGVRCFRFGGFQEWCATRREQTADVSIKMEPIIGLNRITDK